LVLGVELDVSLLDEDEDDDEPPDLAWWWWPPCPWWVAWVVPVVWLATFVLAAAVLVVAAVVVVGVVVAVAAVVKVWAAPFWANCCQSEVWDVVAAPPIWMDMVKTPFGFDRHPCSRLDPGPARKRQGIKNIYSFYLLRHCNKSYRRETMVSGGPGGRQAAAGPTAWVVRVLPLGWPPMMQPIHVTHAQTAGGQGGGACDAQALLARAAVQAGIGAWACDLADSALSWTPAVYQLFGLSPANRLDRRETVGLYEEESRAAMECLRADAIAHARAFTMEAQIIRPDGARRWMRLSADVLRENGRITRLYGLKQDITEERERWEALRRLAEHDALTGLANRAVYESLFLNAPRGQGRLAPLGALVLVDLDRFKQVNDRFGHGAGDACLRAAARRLATAFPDALLVARIGGDEFAVLTPANLSPRALQRRVARMLVDVRRPIEWRGHRLACGASAGLALAEDPCRYDAEALSALADAALYGAKRAGRGLAMMRDAAARLMACSGAGGTCRP
jgi:diguanylate cyclase (GGDEF)-like protein/PAS domain S-box-containing protein